MASCLGGDSLPESRRRQSRDAKLVSAWAKLSFLPPGEYPLRRMAECILKFDGPEIPPEGAPLPSSALRVGDLIGDRWVVLDGLGTGRFCRVYLALDREDAELVALKTIRDDIRVQDEDRGRFHNEALSWANVERHPYILEAKKVANVVGNVRISMEYIPPHEGRRGSSLREWLRDRKPLGQEWILRWAIQFCYGMEHAYNHGIKCHLDVKPENILIDPEQKVRIADFGLANGVGGSGTPFYMPPEQFQKGAAADLLNDIYSVGMVLFEMATGHLPFNPNLFRYAHRCRNMKDACWAAWQEAHSRDPVPDIGEPFGTIIRKCLEKKRGDRFGNFHELRKELSKLCRKINVVIEEPTIEPATPLDICTKGEQLLSLGLFEEALRRFDQVLQAEPANLPALGGKGLCYFSLERWEEALRHFDQVLEISPHDVTALIGKGLCLRKLKKSDQAYECLRRALELQPRLPAVWYHMAKSWVDRGLRDKARECYYRSLDLLVSLKRKDEALEVLREALQDFPHDLRLLQHSAWVHRIRGWRELEEDLEQSRKVMEDLYRKGEHDAETLGMLAGTLKRLWMAYPQRYGHLLPKALEHYHRAWGDSKHGNTYVGINAATLSLLLGRPEDSREIANEIRGIYQRRDLTSLSGRGVEFSSYWDRATLSEAELLLGRLGKARRLYKDVMDLYHDKRSYIDSSKDQIDLILRRLGLSINAIGFLQLSLKPPGSRRVCFGITGHRKLESPEKLEEKLRGVMTEIRQELPNDISFEILSPLAEGADRMAAKVILAEPDTILRVPMPLEVEDYFQDFEGAKSQDEFRGYLNRAEEMIFLPHAKNRKEAYRNVGRYVVDHCDVLIALWDGKDEKGIGGTGEVVAYARKNGVPLIWIDTTPPHKTTFERLEKLKAMDFLRGEFDMYKPKPIDTSHVQLSDDLLELMELLAENAHDTWAKQRMEEGWTYGPERDDKGRKNPDLISYSDLPASEKEYDRKMAMETLKAIISLGYRIEKI